MYSINKQHFTTSMPRRVDDDTMLLAGDRELLGTDLGNLLYDIASLMAQFHDSITALSDPTAQYDQVLKYDSNLRAVGTHLGSHLYASEAPEAFWPQWARWVPGVATVVQAHKIITIHRSFLSKSFTDPRYTYTRWASIAASKTILREAEKAAADAERPALWHDQSHLIGAGITLCLDILHRSEADPEFAEYQKLVDRAVALLNKYHESTLASRGIRLLSSLRQGSKRQHARRDKEGRAHPQEGKSLAWPLEDRQSIDAMWASKQSTNADEHHSTFTKAVAAEKNTPLTFTPTTPIGGDTGALEAPVRNPEGFNSVNGDGSFLTMNDNGMFPDGSWWTDLVSDYFPAQDGFENPFSVEDLWAHAP